jgi:hypothetical protein
MAESETAESEVMRDRRYQSRLVGKWWTDRKAKSVMAAAIAEAISSAIDKQMSDIRPMVIEVRDPELPHDITTMDVVCLVQFMVTTRDPSERN